MSQYSLLQVTLNKNWFENEELYLKAQEHLKNPKIANLMQRLYNKDPKTQKHCIRVGEKTQWLGAKLGLSLREQEELFLCGILHDIGKANTPINILTKPGPLLEAEIKIMKKHAEHSAKIVSVEIPEMPFLIKVLRAHHERFDGDGYPDGLQGDSIPLYARIIFVVDTFDAMSNSRSYRKSLSLDFVYDEIARYAGTQFDSEIAALFIKEHKSSQEFVEFEKIAA